MQIWDEGPVLTVDEVKKFGRLRAIIKDDKVYQEWLPVCRVKFEEFEKYYSKYFFTPCFSSVFNILVMAVNFDIEVLKNLTLEQYVKLENLDEIHAKYSHYAYVIQLEKIKEEFAEILKSDAQLREEFIGFISKKRLDLQSEKIRILNLIHESAGCINLFLNFDEVTDFSLFKRLKSFKDINSLRELGKSRIVKISRFHALEFSRIQVLMNLDDAAEYFIGNSYLADYYKIAHPYVWSFIEKELQIKSARSVIKLAEERLEILIEELFRGMSSCRTEYEQALKSFDSLTPQISEGIAKIVKDNLTAKETGYRKARIEFEEMFAKSFPPLPAAISPQGRGGGRGYARGGARTSRGGRAGRVYVASKREKSPSSKVEEPDHKRLHVLCAVATNLERSPV